MSVSPDPEQATWIATIITAVALVIIALLKKTKSGKEKARVAEAVLTERPVSHTELVECKLELTNTFRDLIRAEFSTLRTEFVLEIKDLHKRINSRRVDDVGK